MNFKTFSIHTVRNVLAVVIALGLGYAAYVVNPVSVTGPNVKAGASQNLSGWAWSENIGWVSFNGNDCDNNGTTFLGAPTGCPANGTAYHDYGVNIGAPSGDFTGQAWSENLGWIDFAPTGPYPEAPNHGARLEGSTVTGWARALAGCQATSGVPATSCSSVGAGAAAGGWDGWIKMSGMTSGPTPPPAPYGVSYSATTGNKLVGYAWGGDVVGWIDFAPPNGGIAYSVSIGGKGCTLPSGTNPSCNVTAWWNITGLPPSEKINLEFVGGGVAIMHKDVPLNSSLLSKKSPDNAKNLALLLQNQGMTINQSTPFSQAVNQTGSINIKLIKASDGSVLVTFPPMVSCAYGSAPQKQPDGSEKCVTQTVCPSGQAYYLGGCMDCGNTGCTGTGGSITNPNGGLTCNAGGSAVPPLCACDPATETLVGGKCVPNCTNGATNPTACTICPVGKSMNASNQCVSLKPKYQQF